MSVSPLRANSSASCTAGRSVSAPDICSVKIFAHPASVSASRCKARFWSTVDTRAQPISIGFDVISPVSDDRARATFGTAGRSRRFDRAAGRPVFLRLMVMNPLETQPHSYLYEAEIKNTF
jgi:hypothetical protein